MVVVTATPHCFVVLLCLRVHNEMAHSQGMVKSMWFASTLNSKRVIPILGWGTCWGGGRYSPARRTTWRLVSQPQWLQDASFGVLSLLVRMTEKKNSNWSVLHPILISVQLLTGASVCSFFQRLCFCASIIRLSQARKRQNEHCVIAPNRHRNISPRKLTIVGY